MAQAAPQVVVLSSIDWNVAWQRHQIFASRFAERGSEVFFVENSGLRNPRLGDFPRLWRRLLGLVAPSRRGGTNILPERVELVTPNVLPPTHGLFRRLNRAVFVPLLAAALERRGLRRGAVAVVYVPTATTLQLLDLLAPSLVVYDCASNFRGHPQAPPDIVELERRLLERADLVVCDSDFLFERNKKEHGNVVQIHQGVSERFFAAQPAKTDFKRLGYYGSWTVGLDADAVASLSRGGFDVTVSGFIRPDSEALPSEVRTLPPTTTEGVVGRAEQFDAVLFPYRVTPFMHGVVPAKLYECFAMGRPVIASPLPSLLPLEGLLYISRSPEDWLRIARDLPRAETPELRERRVALAREHTHDKEFARLEAAIEATRAKLAGRPPAPAGPAPLLASFLHGFGWIGSLYAAARALTLAGHVLAGRLLGPVEYGKANLIIAMGVFLQVLPTLGFPLALAKLPADDMDEERRSRLISTTLTIFALWTAACFALTRWMPAVLAWGGVAVPVELWPYAVALALLTALYTVLASPLLGLRRFAARGASETFYGVLVPAGLAALFLSGRRDFTALVDALYLGLVGGMISAAWSMRRYLRPTFDSAAVRVVLGYALLGALNMLTAACVIAPGRLLLHHYVTTSAVGVFSAYFTASVQLCLAGLTIAGAVIVPLASTRAGQLGAWRMFRSAVLPVAVGGLLLFTATTAAGLKLFGRRYPLDLWWVAAFALAADAVLVQGLIAALFSARDLAGLRVSVTGNGIAAAGNVALGLLLIPRWGIPAAAVAMIGSYAAGIAYLLLRLPSPVPVDGRK